MTSRERSWVVAVHVVSFVLLTAAVFRVNQAALFLRWDGLLHLVEDRVQHVWGGPPWVLNLDVLMANGEMTFPNFYGLNPAMIIARWAGHGETVVWLASTILASMFFVAAAFLIRNVGFDLGTALGGAWLSCLLTLPYVVPVLTYIRLWGNQPLLAGLASMLVALGIFFRLGRRRLWVSAVEAAAVFVLLAYAAAASPFGFVIGAPVVGFFALVAVATASSRREIGVKILAGLAVAAALAPLAAFVVELHAYSKVPFFRGELAAQPVRVRDVSFFLHVHEEAGWLGAAVLLAAVATAIFTTRRAPDGIRRVAIGYLAFMGMLLAAVLTIAVSAGEWWGPPIAYFDMVALPFHCAFLAVLGGAAARWAGLREPAAAARVLQKRWIVVVVLAVLPWLCLPVSLVMAAVPGLARSHTWPWPIRKTPLVLDLEREIALTPGARFRGRVVNLAGARGIYPRSHPPFNNQHAYDQGFISTVGNDHRSLGFWSYSIPTLNVSSQFTTPFFHLVMTRFLNEPHSLAVRAHETATRFDVRILAMLGVRFVIHESPISSTVRRGEYAMAGRTLYLHEIGDPNIGTYSPTKVHVVATAKAAITLMARPELDLRRAAIVHESLPDDLVTATSDGLRVFRDALRVHAESRGTSLLVLPLEYSHCLVFDLSTLHPESLRIMRVNVNQTGLLFHRAVSGNIRLRFGPFVNRGCRFKDFAEARALRVGETDGWWPESPE